MVQSNYDGFGLDHRDQNQLLSLWRFRARRMSWDDIESENSLITLASTSPSSVPPRIELVKSVPKQTQLKFDTRSASDLSLFISTTSLPELEVTKGSELGG